MQHIFKVQGMTCGHCEKAVTRAIQDVDPAAKVQIDRAQDSVVVDTEVADRTQVLEAIKEEGYAVG